MTIRDAALDMARRYWEERPAKEFVPGETYIPSTGKILDANDICAGVGAVLDGWLTDGPEAMKFESAIRDVLEHKSGFVSLCNSGSSANLLAVSAITAREFGSRAAHPGDEVIVPACGFPTTINPIIQNRLVPVFVDVSFPTYLADHKEVEHAITDKTKAILLPHTLGNTFNLDVFRDMADEYGVWLISDSCDAFGARSCGHPVGTVEDLSTLSFYPAHQVTAGEGGAVISGSPMVKKVVESFRDWGRDCICPTGKDNTCGKRFSQPCDRLPQGYDHKYIYSRIGYNLKMTDMQAAIGASQVRRLTDFVARRQHNWGALRAGMEKYEKYFILPEPDPASSPSWFGFCLTLQKSDRFSRHDLIQFLEERKIGTRLLFGSNLLAHPAYARIEHRIFNRLDNSNVILRDTFWVGVWPGITDEMIAYILQSFEDFIKGIEK